MHLPPLPIEVLCNVFHYLPGRYNKAILSLVCKDWEYAVAAAPVHLVPCTNPLIQDFIVRGRSNTYTKENIELATFIKTNVCDFEDDEIQNVISFFISLGVPPLTFGRYSEYTEDVCLDWYAIRRCDIPEGIDDSMLSEKLEIVSTLYFIRGYGTMDLLCLVLDNLRTVTSSLLEFVEQYNLYDEIYLFRYIGSDIVLVDWKVMEEHDELFFLQMCEDTEITWFTKDKFMRYSRHVRE